MEFYKDELGFRYLPTEAMKKILVKLPARKILSLRSVSKHWHTLISNAISDLCFTHSHLEHEITIPKVIVQIGLANLRRIYPDKTDEPWCELVASCHGLLMYKSCEPNRRSHYPYRSRLDNCFGYVFNPVTRQSIGIPEWRNKPNPNLYAEVEFLGFFFDPPSRKYKILRAYPSNRLGNKSLEPRHAHYFNYETLTLGTESWEPIQNTSCFNFFCAHHSRHVNVNGALYWLVVEVESGCRCIASFDIQTHVFRKVSLPQGCSDDPEVQLIPDCHYIQEGTGCYRCVFSYQVPAMHIIEVDGCLSLCVISSEKEMEFWVLKEEDWNKEHSWIKLCSISSGMVNLLKPEFWEFCGFFQFRPILADNEKIMFQRTNADWFHHRTSYREQSYIKWAYSEGLLGLFVYHAKSKRFKEVCFSNIPGIVCREVIFKNYFYQVHKYVKGLVSPIESQ